MMERGGSGTKSLGELGLAPKGQEFSLAGKHVLVLGLGMSGRAVTLEVLRQGGRATATDTSFTDEMRRLTRELEEQGAVIILGNQAPDLLKGVDLTVVSPGVPWDLPLLAEARKSGLPVWSEIELAARLSTRPFIAVTGTNGKTTTVTLLGKMLEEAGGSPLVAGNVGWPLVEAVRSRPGDGPVVAEVSSFQLEGIDTFRPRIAVVLNLGEDHIDRHGTFEAYIQAKARIFDRQITGDWAILNYDDGQVWELRRQTKAKVIPFSARILPEGGVGPANGRLAFDHRGLDLGRPVFAEFDPKTAGELCAIEDIRLPGSFNLENVAAAAAAALAWGADPQAIGRAIRAFSGLAHRLQFAGEVSGIRFYDDSKATNPHAALRAAGSFHGPLLILLGGKNKGLDLGVLRDLSPHVRKVLLFGEAGEELASIFAGDPRAERCASLEEAAGRAFDLAHEGETVLLSPACASFDAFRNYAERGDCFQDEIRKMAGRAQSKGHKRS